MVPGVILGGCICAASQVIFKEVRTGGIENKSPQRAMSWAKTEQRVSCHLTFTGSLLKLTGLCVRHRLDCDSTRCIVDLERSLSVRFGRAGGYEPRIVVNSKTHSKPGSLHRIRPRTDAYFRWWTAKEHKL